MPKRIFISVANNEHETLRAQMRDLLTRTGFDVVVQPDFPHTAADTIRKLDARIAPCDLLIHMVGQDSGTRANSDAVADFFKHTPRENFLTKHPNASKLLGDCSQLTYFQWEPWIALNRDIDVIVYGTEGHGDAGFPQRDQLDNLYLARCHAETLQDNERRCAQIVGDVCSHFGIVPPSVEQKIAPTRFNRHAAQDFLGREVELGLLDAAWDGAETMNVFCVIAWGGVGKTALLAKWVQQRFIAKQWRNADGEPDPLFYFDWTFYDQGTRPDDDTKAGAASVGAFFETALTFFGDDDPTQPGKGARLAERVQAHRSLLVLDGLEPLQYPPNHPQAGQITDPDLRVLLETLAMHNPGLCVVSSRQALTDLRGDAARNHDLDQLPDEVAIRLLQQLQVVGSDADLAQAAQDYAGHALSLILLGRYLFVSKGGDIRKRDTIKLEKANKTREARTRNAWHVLDAYQQWLQSPDGNPEDLEALRLLGLFDRPASPDCLAALRAEPAIDGLTDRLLPLDNDDWNALLHRLNDARLIQLRFPEETEMQGLEAREVPVDAHPLIREYFSKQLRDHQPDAFKTAHSRLFDHLCENTEHQPDTLEGLQPLYQAVVHGCLAGRQQEACDKVYIERIKRGMGHDGNYSSRKLGAIGSDLGAVAAFFEQPWTRLSPNLSEHAQAWLLNEAAFRLRALGRLTEALEPMRVPGENYAKAENWIGAAITLGNLSELEVTLGRLGEAVADARRAIDFADRSGDAFQRMGKRATAADALHQSGERDEARELLEEAEALQRERQPEFNLLYSLPGFRYSDLILAPAERGCGILPQERRQDPGTTFALAEAERRGNKMFEWRELGDPLLDIALDHLTLARVALYRALLAAPHPDTDYHPPHLLPALDGFRKAGQIQYLPPALLTAAQHHHFTGDPDTARRHLDEAQQIAERGPMPLYLADVHLHRARLFRDKSELALAAALIHKHEYGRRYEELADAEEAAAEW